MVDVRRLLMEKHELMCDRVVGPFCSSATIWAAKFLVAFVRSLGSTITRRSGATSDDGRSRHA
jgi:hypothetical protein